KRAISILYIDRFLFLDGKTCEEIKTKLDAVYGNSSSSMTTVRYWFNEFKRDRSSVFDEERPDHSADVITEEIVEKVHDMILADRRTKVYEVAEAVGVSYGTAFNILHDNLGIKKLSARWVPRLLTVDNKWMRLSISKHSRIALRIASTFVDKWVDIERLVQSNTPSSLVIQDFVIELVKIHNVHNVKLSLCDMCLHMKSSILYSLCLNLNTCIPIYVIVRSSVSDKFKSNIECELIAYASDHIVCHTLYEK
ncbi:SETMR methyltransferase, partial [Acromyrmex heyeri]